MRTLRALAEETLAAAIALTLLSVVISLTYWFATKDSPWPFVVLAEAVAFGWGLVLLIVTSPTWRRL